MRLPKKHRRILKPTKHDVAEVRMLTHRLKDSHLRWVAMAAYPGRTPLAAVIIYAAERRKKNELSSGTECT